MATDLDEVFPSHAKFLAVSDAPHRQLAGCVSRATLAALLAPGLPSWWGMKSHARGLLIVGAVPDAAHDAVRLRVSPETTMRLHG